MTDDGDAAPTPDQPRTILLNRAVATIRPDRIEIRPDKVLVVGPLLGVMFGLGCAVGIWIGRHDAPTWLLAIFLLGALVSLPFAGMSLVYTISGVQMIVDRAKQSIVFQQGVLGLGVGTAEVAPFWKIKELEIEDLADGVVAPTEELVQWQLTLLKESGRRLPIASLTCPREQEDLAFEELNALATAISAMAGDKPVRRPAAFQAAEQAVPKGATQRRRRRTRPA